MKAKILSLLLFVLLAVSAIQAQTTAFTYQGKLNDSSAPQPTTGNYDFQFSLFDIGNNQIGATVTKSNVQVVGGIFTVLLDFGSNPFAIGDDRFLEISVKRIADPAYVTLSPRQQLASAPYAVQTLNASLLGGLPASQFVQVDDARLSDDRNPLPFSANYIQNGTGAQTASFNVSGTGTVGGNLSANSVNSTTNFKIGNQIVFSTPNQTSVVAGSLASHTIVSSNSSFFGYRAGFSSNSFSFSNTFIGSEAGQGTTSGWNNTFVGKNAGYFNISGTGNSIFGSDAGKGSGAGSASFNSIFGYESGLTVSGSRNSFFGFQAGRQNQTANDNAFFGYQAGTLSTAGGNSFFGGGAGGSNTTGSDNVFVGTAAGSGNTTGFGNTFVGTGAAGSSILGSNNTVVGRQAGGFGPNFITNTSVGYLAGQSSNSIDNTFLGANTNTISGVTHSTAIGADAVVDTNNTIMLGTVLDTVRIPNHLLAGSISASSGITASSFSTNGTATIAQLKLTTGTGPGSGVNLCLRALDVVVTCSSSLRYKTNISDYTHGLDVIRQLRPITFNWKTDGASDIGFGAEEVEKVDSRLVNYNADGKVEAVKYDRISTALVNAVKEQQLFIETLQEQIKKQQEIINGLKSLVCENNNWTSICQENEQK